MYKSAHGEWVLYGEAQAEIDALKAENKRLQEKCEHSTIARFNWRNKYLTLIGSVIATLGLDDLTARDDVVLAVEAIKAQNAELLAAQQWRDIESAPRDGTWFLACSITKGWSATRIVRFHRPDDSMPCNGEGMLWPSAPTHWQPLPPAPIAKATGEKS